MTEKKKRFAWDGVYRQDSEKLLRGKVCTGRILRSFCVGRCVPAGFLEAFA